MNKFIVSSLVAASMLVASAAIAADKAATTTTEKSAAMTITTTEAPAPATTPAGTSVTMTFGDQKALEGTEKCFGVAKAGKGECAGGVGTCVSKDSSAEEFVMLPKGVCDKLVNGSLQAPQPVAVKK